MRRKLLLTTLVLGWLWQAGLFAALEAGAAAVQLPAAPGLKMSGFSQRHEPARETLDPLFVRVLMLRSAGRSVAFVVYDLIGILDQPLNAELTERIRQRTGIDEVIFSATHTHSGPELAGADGLDRLPAFEQALGAATIRALEQAREALEPVRLGVGYGRVDLNYNRIKELPGGGVEMIWINHEQRPLGPTEQTVLVLRLDDLQGRTRVLLVNYACHPVILGFRNLRYSPDYPGAMCRELERSHPDRPTCLFLNGACGDMNPYFADADEQAEERVEEAGRELAGEVLRVARSIAVEEAADSAGLDWKIVRFPARGRWDLERWRASAGDRSRAAIERTAARMERLELPISLVRITPQLAFVGLPGEFFSAFQRSLRAQSPVKDLIVAGYTGGGFGYFPDLTAAVRGGYGANDEATVVRPGTGEQVVIEAVAGLNELLGNLRPVPASGEDGYRR